jgi:aminoglycoside phosphotransferase (APT) family kinase protein
MSVRGINVDAVTSWLVANVPGAVAPFTFDLIAGGRSNLTFKVTGANGTQFVLRRPPLGNVLASAHDMGREFRLISAVSGSGVPVAPALGMCTDISVNDAPFYVMGFVDGVVLDSPEKGGTLTEEARRNASISLADTLAALHSVDIDTVGLGDLAKRADYVGRQLKRWSGQWDASKTRELPSMERVRELLEAGKPEQRFTGIVHGDYRFGNVLVDPATGQLQAVLDWELCTLGDVLADVGYVISYWTDPGEEFRRENDPSGHPGFFSRAEFVQRYAEVSGRSLTDVAWYEAFACWRLACIAEGVLARYLAGVMGDAVDTTGMAGRVDALAAHALALLQG